MRLVWRPSTIKHKFDKNSDTPISVRDYQNIYEDRTLICSFCNRTMQRLWDSSRENPSWFCSACQIETSSEEADYLRTRSRLQMPEGVNTTPHTARPPEPELRKKKTEVKGVLAEFQRRGMKIKNYNESNTRR